MTAGAAAAAAARLRTPGTRALCWALKAPQPSLSVVGSNLPYRHFDDAFRSRRVTSATTTPPRPPPCSKPTDAAAIEDAERGLRILRERADALEQDDAVEAWRSLLRAACAESVPADVYFALGNLHYVWGELLEFGKRAELGAEGAARAVVGEIKKLRQQAMKKRQLAPASSGAKHRTRKGSANDEEDRALFRGNVGDAGDAAAAAAGNDRKQAPPAEVDHPEAWEWYLKAATCGDTRAMMQLGDIAMESVGKSAANIQHAQAWYRKAAGGHPPQPNGIFQMARIHHEGIGVPCDPARARALYDEAQEAGSPAAGYFMGHRFHVGDETLGVEVDGARALQLLRGASEQGHAEATFYLAQAYRSGDPEMGLPRDLRVFGDMVQQAAAAGSADALFALGGAFFHGEDGFARDPRAAFRCYAAAADRGGHADASYCLGVMHYAMGDLQEAFRRYQNAAEGGNMLAWRNLASMYALGEGVARSEQMAKNILARFADKIEQQGEEEKGGGGGKEEKDRGEEEEVEEEEEGGGGEGGNK